MSRRHLRSSMIRFESALWRRGLVRVAGVDEAGRGPLAGPVVAAAVILPVRCSLEGIKDSKVLTPAQRDDAFDRILSRAAAVGTGIVDHATIDRINVLQATFCAMREAIRTLSLPPDYLLVDGNRFFDVGIPYTTIVHGDALSLSVAAASIVAKVTRDRLMVRYDSEFPGYGFARHKGYPTRAHREAIRQLGFCAIHRRSFHVR